MVSWVHATAAGRHGAGARGGAPTGASCGDGRRRRRGAGHARPARPAPTPGAPRCALPPRPRGPAAERLSERLGHDGFRLFLRGAIAMQGPFKPAEATRYLSAAQAERAAAELVELGLALCAADGHVRLRWRARSFGHAGVVGRAELRRRLAADVVAGVRSGAPGVGGDLDVVAAAEGKLVYVELKSSPPKHIMPVEVAAFLDACGRCGRTSPLSRSTPRSGCRTRCCPCSSRRRDTPSRRAGSSATAGPSHRGSTR